MAIDGDTLVIGAPGESGSDGAVYVYTYDGIDWTQQERLTGDEAAGRFGFSVVLDGNRLAAVGTGRAVQSPTRRMCLSLVAHPGTGRRNWSLM